MKLKSVLVVAGVATAATVAVRRVPKGKLRSLLQTLQLRLVLLSQSLRGAKPPRVDFSSQQLRDLMSQAAAEQGSQPAAQPKPSPEH